jgi:cell wall-associated NlpC family hydrolase
VTARAGGPRPVVRAVRTKVLALALLTGGPLLAQVPASPSAAAATARPIATVATVASAPRPAAVKPLGVRAVAVAAKQYGKPYRWAATGPTRFDCSGLTMYVYQRLGKRLPHSSRAQYAVTRHVSRSTLRPGDLVFTVRRGSIRHVGIYAGGNRMWAATQSGDVVRTQSLSGRTLRFGRVR